MSKYTRKIDSSLYNYNYKEVSLTSGNASANMNTTGLTNLSEVMGQDDTFGYIPLTFNFYFYGINYGNSQNSGIYWNTNNVIGFGPGNGGGQNQWDVNNKAITIGNMDRRTNNFYYSGKLTSNGFEYINTLLFAQNHWLDTVPNTIQYQIRLFAGNNLQYIEIRSAASPSTAGNWNITNGTVFQNTFNSFINTIPTQSCVLVSNNTGSKWNFYNNYYVNI